MNRVQIFTKPSLIASACTVDNRLTQNFDQLFLNTMTLAELVFDLTSGTRYTRDTITICPLQSSSKIKVLFHETTMKRLTT